MRVAVPVSLALVWFLASCNSSEKVAGTVGTPCFPDGTCVEGLICINDLCEVDPTFVPQGEDVSLPDAAVPVDTVPELLPTPDTWDSASALPDTVDIAVPPEEVVDQVGPPDGWGDVDDPEIAGDALDEELLTPDQSCTPQSCGDLDKECGQWNNGCGGVVHCGECQTFPNSFCSDSGQCDCSPDCEGKECGMDLCGGSCGECPAFHQCQDFTCVSQPGCGNGVCEEGLGEDCSACAADCGCVEPQVCWEGACCSASDCNALGKECGQWPDGCGGEAQCGTCTGQDTCVNGQCVCQQACGGKECGGDGCGGTCGTCAGQDTCVNGQCVCQPACGGKVCGDDGCGGTCGSCQGYKVCADFGATCKTPVDTNQYRVGVDYHATTSDFTQTAFLSQYHKPSVRNTVLSQLQGMADDGAGIISTRVWMVSKEGEVPSENYRWNFPPTQQQLDNLRQYVIDVSTIVSPAGKPMELDLCMLYLWCAEYREGTPTTTLGKCGLTPAQYDAAMKATHDGIINAVRGIYRPDGQHAVTLLYMDGEVMTAVDDGDPATQWEKKNQRWFLAKYYPDFVQKTRAAGMIPFLYFLTSPSEAEALDNDFSDGYLPELNGHRSVYWIYRTLKFMKNTGLPVPERIDFSLYPNPPFEFSNEPTVISRVLDDLEATAEPLLGGPLRYGIAETIYYHDTASRHRVGKAFAAERQLRGSNPEFVTFWSTPYNGGQTEPSGYPFDIDAFRGDDVVYPLAGTNPSFEVVGDDSLPDQWELAWSNGNVSSWSASAYWAGDALDGDRVLRLQSGTCSGCNGAWDGVYVRSDQVPVTPGEMAVVRLFGRHSIDPSGAFPTEAYSGPIATLTGYKADNSEKILAQVGMRNGYWKFRRHLLVARIPNDVVKVALRFGLLDAWQKTLDVDKLH